MLGACKDRLKHYLARSRAGIENSYTACWGKGLHAAVLRHYLDREHTNAIAGRKLEWELDKELNVDEDENARRSRHTRRG
jgi:hypothetical protein